MKKYYVEILVACAVLGLLFFGWFVVKQNQLGAQSLTYTGAVGRLETYNVLQSLIQDLNTLRIPLAGVSSFSASYNFGTITSSTASSTQIATPGAVAGDFVIASVATGTVAGLNVNAWVSGAGTTTVSVSNTGANVNMGTPVIGLRVFASSTFSAPPALNTATSSTP